MDDPIILAQAGEAGIDGRAFAELLPAGAESVGRNALDVVELADALGLAVLGGSDDDHLIEVKFVLRQGAAQEVMIVVAYDDGFEFEIGIGNMGREAERWIILIS